MELTYGSWVSIDSPELKEFEESAKGFMSAHEDATLEENSERATIRQLTESELRNKKAQELRRETENAKSELEQTDYAVIKFMDNLIKSSPELLATFNEQYSGLLERRQSARDKVNASEVEMSSL